MERGKQCVQSTEKGVSQRNCGRLLYCTAVCVVSNDTSVLVVKIYKYFHKYTVRVTAEVLS